MDFINLLICFVEDTDQAKESKELVEIYLVDYLSSSIFSLGKTH